MAESLCATKCTEELNHLSDFAIFIQLPKASYTFCEMFNNKTILRSSKKIV